MSKRFGSPPEEHRKRALAAVKTMAKHARTLKRALTRRTPQCSQALHSLLQMEKWDAVKGAETRGADYHRGGKGVEPRALKKMRATFARKCLVNTLAY